MEKTSTFEVDGPEVLVQAVYQAIKEAILANRLRPGNKLGHQALAESLGVSRTPVRESLERLYQEGYVTRVANRGYFVAEIDVNEVRELYQTRAALELYALERILTTGITSGALRKLEKINSRYKALCTEDLSRERLLVDRQFHLALAEQSGNSYLCRTLATIFDRLILKRRVEGYHDLRGVEPYKDHVLILTAIVSENEKTARRVLHHHIEGACTRFTRYLDPLLEQNAVQALYKNTDTAQTTESI